MKCLFAISGEDNSYFDMIKALVYSGKLNTSFDFYCIYDGDNNRIYEWLVENSVTILKWEISFLKNLLKFYDGKADVDICKGMYLCTELPTILQHFNIWDEFVLYVDVDIIFHGKVEMDDIHPTHLCCTPDWAIDDWSRFGTGVILFNNRQMLKSQRDFLDHLKKHNYNFEYMKMGPCDQGAWNSFYGDKIEKLNPIYDWKPWWGIDRDAKIIHFAGPKPRFVERCVIESASSIRYTETEYLHKCLIEDNLSSYTYYLSLWKNYLKN